MKKKIALILVLFVSSLSCSKLTEEEESGSRFLSASVSPDIAYIIPNPDLTKCSSTTSTIAPNVLEYSRVSLSWSSTDSDFRLISMTLQAKSPVLKAAINCSIIGNELNALMPTRTISAITGTEPTTITSSSSCSIRCGNIQLQDNASSAVIPAKIKILGFESFSNGLTVPVTKDVDVTIVYTKF